MEEQLEHALAHDRTTDSHTRGRQTGQFCRTESWFHPSDGQVFLTGMPGRHDGYAKMVAHAEFTFHLKQGTTADLPERATPIRDAARRRQLLAGIHQELGGARALEAWVQGRPRVAVEFLVE